MFKFLFNIASFMFSLLLFANEEGADNRSFNTIDELHIYSQNGEISKPFFGRYNNSDYDFCLFIAELIEIEYESRNSGNASAMTKSDEYKLIQFLYRMLQDGLNQRQVSEELCFSSMGVELYKSKRFENRFVLIIKNPKKSNDNKLYLEFDASCILNTHMHWRRYHEEGALIKNQKNGYNNHYKQSLEGAAHSLLFMDDEELSLGVLFLPSLL